jgi:hypothetical protein
VSGPAAQNPRAKGSNQSTAPPDGRQRTRVFDRKLDAERYLTGVETSKLVGTYIDPKLARLTVGEWAGSVACGPERREPLPEQGFSR